MSMSVRGPSLLPPRLLTHESLIHFATRTTIALASLATRWFLFSKSTSLLRYIPNAIALVYGISACQYAVKAFQFYKKRRFLAAPRLDINVAEYDPAFNRAYQKVTTLIDLDFLVSTYRLSIDERKAFFKRALSHGTFSEEATVLLQLLKQQPTESCSNLLKTLRDDAQVEKIFQTQMLHIVESGILHPKSFFSSSLITGALPNVSRMMLNALNNGLAELNALLPPAENLKSDPFSITAPSSVYLEQMETVFEDGSFCGLIRIGTTVPMGGEDQFMTGHKICFQCSPGRYRFYDAYNPGEGFYEYTDKDSFIEALRSQMIEEMGNEAQVYFST